MSDENKKANDERDLLAVLEGTADQETLRRVAERAWIAADGMLVILSICHENGDKETKAKVKSHMDWMRRKRFDDGE